ncbi:unnamed protein product [Caenorhabditis brenneri]
MWSTLFFLLSLSVFCSPQKPTAMELAEQFMWKLKDAHNSHDDQRLRALCLPRFQFRSCFEIFNRKRSIDTMMSFPFGTSVSKILNVTVDVERDIEFILALDASGQTNLQFVFAIDRFLLKLESVRFAQCPDVISTRGKRSSGDAPKDPDTIIDKFLGTLKQTIAIHDSSAIGQLFDDNFVFKGCRGTYNKAETLAKINQVPKEANFNFALKSANWNNYGQIEYTVTISGALHDDFDAQFVYCPYRQVLKSGSIPSCPAKRMFAKPCLDDLGLFC